MTELDNLKVSINRRKELTFNPEDYEDFQIRRDTNCYAYALDSIYPNRELYRWLGSMSGCKKQLKESNEEMVKKLFKDCACVGKEIRECTYEEDVPEGWYKIAFLSDEKEENNITNFHFIRQDSDGTWSEKKWGELPNKLGKFSKTPFNPETAHWFPFYIVSYFLIKKY